MPVADYAQNTSGVTLNGVLQAIVDLVESTDHSPYARNTNGATTLDGILDAVTDLVGGDDNSPYARNTNGTTTIDGLLDALTDLVTSDDNSPYARNTSGATTLDGILDVLTDAVASTDTSPYGRNTNGLVTLDGILDAMIDALDSGALLGVPLAPVLTWVSDNTVNPPQLDVYFDGTHAWSAGDITGSNFDRIEVQVDQDPLFGSVDETDTNDLDAAELLAGTAQIFPGPLATLVALYIRSRHHHYVAGVAHTSAWSNTETKTLSDVTAPTITSSNAVSVAENATLSHALTANESVTWSIVGGADLAQCEISGSTLRWSSNGTRDYEVPADADTNNTYIVTVRATDLFSNTADQTITVTVTDVSDTAVAAPILPWMASSQPPFLRF